MIRLQSNSKIIGIKNDAKIIGFLNHCNSKCFKMIGFQNDWIPKWLDSKMIGFQHDWIPTWLDSKMIGFQNDWIPKWLDSKMIGFQNDWNDLTELSAKSGIYQESGPKGPDL